MVFYGWELWPLIQQKLIAIMVTSAISSTSKVYTKEAIVCMFEMQLSSSCN